MKKLVAICILFSVFLVACSVRATSGTDRYKKADVKAGKVLYETKCIKCHKPKNTENFTSEKWPSIMKSMGPKAKLTQEETSQVNAYVLTHAKKVS